MTAASPNLCPSLSSAHHRQRRLHIPPLLHLRHPHIIPMTANDILILAGPTTINCLPTNHAHLHPGGFGGQPPPVHNRVIFAALRPLHPQLAAAAGSTITAPPNHVLLTGIIVSSTNEEIMIATLPPLTTRAHLRGLKSKEQETQDTFVRALTIGSTTTTISPEPGTLTGTVTGAMTEVGATTDALTGLETAIDATIGASVNGIGMRTDTPITEASNHAKDQLIEMAGKGTCLRPQPMPKTNVLRDGLQHPRITNPKVTLPTQLPTAMVASLLQPDLHPGWVDPYHHPCSRIQNIHCLLAPRRNVHDLALRPLACSSAKPTSTLLSRQPWHPSTRKTAMQRPPSTM